MSRKLMTELLVLAIAALGFASAAANTIVVDIGGSGDHTAVGPAIAAASEGDTILVMPGTYAGADNWGWDFAGTNVVLRSSDGAATTIIDCEDYTKAISLESGDAGPTTVIDGFTFTSGHASAGGLVYCWQSSPAFIDCVFSNSFSFDVGGAVYLCESTASFTRCVFTGNESGQGGAVQVELASPTFTDCDFTYNTSDNEGGGVDVIWEASPVFDGCTFSNNAGTKGGGIRCYDHSSPTITDCDFLENTATAHGGAVLCDSTSSPTVTGCLFQDNTAQVAGGMSCLGGSSPAVTSCTFIANHNGGVYTDYSSPTFDGCLFEDNTAKYGAGAYLYQSSSAFTDCTFLGNYASGAGSDGGALSCDFADIEVANCTFSDNGADEGGGSVHCWNSDPTLTNCIIAFSTSGPALDCDEGTESPTLICCDLFGNAGGDWVGCIADQSGIGNNVSEDPLFCDRPGGDFTIDAASPCAPLHSSGCGLLGALPVACDSPVQVESWGSIKAMYR